MDELVITQDDLIAALLEQQARDCPNDASTVPELCAQTGLSDRVVRQRLMALKLAGRLIATRKPVVNLAGYAQAVPAYRMKQ